MYDLHIVPGVTFRLPIRFEQPDGTPVDLSTADLEFELLPHALSEDTILSVEPAREDDLIVTTLSHEQTRALKPWPTYYYLWVHYHNDTKKPILHGDVRVGQ